jgi:hypothetical protein
MRVQDRGVIHDSAARPPGERVAAFTSLCRLRSGTILCGFQAGPAKHAPTSTARLCRSQDGGRTWHDVPARFETCIDGVPGSLTGAEMVEADPGRLLLFATWFDRSDPGRPLFDPQTEGILRSKQLMSVSVDDGLTWNRWTQIPTPGLFGCSSTGPVLRWPDGTIGFAFESYKEYDDPRPGRHAAWLLISRDGGQTFGDPILIAQDPGHEVCYWDQRMCVGAKPHEFIALFWTHDRAQKHDLPVHRLRASLGEAPIRHAQIAPTGIPGQIAAPLLMPDGKLLAFVVEREGTSAMTLWQSSDGGESWPVDERLVVYAHDERAMLSQRSAEIDFKEYWDDMIRWTFGHPAICALEHNRVLVAYYAGVPGSTSIHWARVE